MIKFEYNGKIYAPSNLEKKLKKLGATMNDIKIIEDTTETVKTTDSANGLTYHQVNDIELYFYKTDADYTITSIKNYECLPNDAAYVGSTRNADGKIERIDEAEKRLNINFKK